MEKIQLNKGGKKMFQELNENEILETEGGLVLAVIGTSIAICSALYGAAYAVGQYVGNRNK